MKLVMISRLDDPDALKYTAALASDLQEEGYTIQFEKGTGEALGERGVEFTELSGDIAVVVGGDGSVLLTVQKMKTQIPIIGINWGEVGFLAELEPNEVKGYFRSIRQTGFKVEQRMRIALFIDGEKIGDALNEAVIVTRRPAKMLRFSIRVDGIQAERFRSDGLVISTPTGSTAYAMSAGGPIIDPRIKGFLLVPLAPYLLSSRPHIISNDRRLEIKLESIKPARLVLDGQETYELKNDSIVRIEKATTPASFVDVGKNFFLKVDNKLRRL
jgi:NAD+ kinase